MQNIHKSWTNNRLTILILFISVIGLPVIAAMSAPTHTSLSIASATPAPRYSGVKLPSDYRADYIHYATIQRPDGTIRDVYVNPDGFSGFKGNTLFPENTTIVIDGYYALQDDKGVFITDEKGHYTRGTPFDMIHVRQKRSDWLPLDFVSEARNGDWNYGSFDSKTSTPYDESISACFNCHQATNEPDYLYTYSQLVGYLFDGKTQYFICNLTGRSAC